MVQRGVDDDHFSIRSAESSQVASYLSAADVGVAFYKPALSRLATSPVKLTEYLACGLPVIVNAGVGDSDDLVTRERVGALVRDFNEQEYENAATAIESFITDAEETRRRTREVAERLFDVRKVGVERYARLYERVLTD
jgi:glycosyltransferase involved in cell wall biosynthesis